MARILKIPEAASLAIHSMAMLAGNPGKLLTTREMAAELEASCAHLAKVMHRLEASGLVSSSRGPKGGYFLRLPPESITLKTIYEAVEGPIAPSRCLLETRICGGEKCAFGRLLASLDGQLREHLEKTRLSELATIKETAHAQENH